MTTSAAESDRADYVKAQFERVRRLELLYFRDGRHHPDHPYHSLYTGLYLQSQSPTSC